MSVLHPDLLEPPPDPAGGRAADETETTRSPGQIAWRRFRRDRVGVVSGVIVAFFIVVAVAAPLIGAAYGRDPTTTYGQDRPGLLDQSGFPVGRFGGIGGDFWLGLEPGLGRDVFMQLVYGARTSLFIAFTVALITTTIGVVYGIVTGYLGGRVDAIGGRIIDVFLTFPGLLLIIALSPIVEAAFVAPDEESPVWMRFAVVIILFSTFGWVFQARLIRGQVLSLREREFVDAARVSGAGTWRIVSRELLPNLWSPILVTISLAVPSIITAEAALAFLGIGIVEPTPDWGRMVEHGAAVYLADPTYMLVPGGALLVLVLSFNLLGDAVRDALDPKGLR
jgi:peptide/nickel transport system permease protein